MKKPLITKEYLADLFNQFNRQNVLIIGDVMVDGYTWGKVERISAEAPVPIIKVEKKENRLGGAANVALNIQALGATPILCSVIGKDAQGKIFLELLKKQKLTKEGIVSLKHRVTTVKTRMIGNKSQLLRVDEEKDDDIETDETATLFKLIQSITATKKIDVIIFEDYDKGTITKTLIELVVALAKKKDIPVCVDPKKRNFMDYKHVDLLKPNIKELHEGTKIDIDPNNLTELTRIVEKFRLKQKINTVMVTLAEKGVITSSKIAKRHFPAHIRSIVDVSGAGDTVISVAALCKALKCDDGVMASLANLAGGLVCEEIGVVPINKKLLLQEAVSFDFAKSAH